MENERKTFATFLSMNARRAATTETPAAHMQFHSQTMHTGEPLLLMERDDILGELDTDSRPVRWLLNQLATYDCRRQKIVGLIFDRQTVLSEVLWDGEKLQTQER